MKADGPVLGRLITDGDRRRDAVHVAVVPVTADGHLDPGQAVEFSRDGSTEHVQQVYDDSGPAVGIVDPYLARQVKPGDRFWLFLFPNTVTGLRHVWTHPAFAARALTPKEGEPCRPTEPTS